MGGCSGTMLKRWPANCIAWSAPSRSWKRVEDGIPAEFEGEVGAGKKVGLERVSLQPQTPSGNVDYLLVPFNWG